MKREKYRAKGVPSSLESARVVTSSPAKLTEPFERDCPAQSELASMRLCLYR